jgi:two-component system, chemotaxis family, protein-glutamate methylesterase/glutaminase
MIARASYSPVSADPPRRVVAVGASSGGVQALPELLRHLPADLDAAFFIVQHICPDRPSGLSQLLGRATAWPCADAEDARPFAAGHVYLAPPDRHLWIDRTRMYLSRSGKVCHARPSVDVLFRSVAEAFGRRAIGIILTGRLNDGTDGLRAIEAAGGVSIVQEPNEARAPGMPSSALSAVRIDHRLAIGDIALTLRALIGRAVARPVSTRIRPNAGEQEFHGDPAV